MAALEDLVIKFSADTSNAVQGVDKVQEKLSGLEKAADQISSTFGRVFERITEYLAAREIIKQVSDIVSSIDEIGHAAEIMGTSVENFTRLTYAAHQADVSTEQLTTSVRFMQRALETAGQNQNLTDAFNKLKVNVKSIIDLKPEDQLARIAEGFKNITNPAEKTRVAMELFGRSGAVMIPLLNEGADGFKRLGQEADAAGATISGSAFEAAKKYEDEMHKLADAWEGAKAKLAETGVFEAIAEDMEKLIPIIQALGDGFAHLGDRFHDFSVGVKSLVSGTDYYLKNVSASGLSMEAKNARDPQYAQQVQAEITNRATTATNAKTGVDSLVKFFGWGDSAADVGKELQSKLTGIMPTSNGEKAQGFTKNVSEAEKKSGLEAQKKLQEEINTLMGKSETIQQKLNDDMAKAYDLRKSDKITEEQFNTIMDGLGKKLDEANRKLDTMDNKVKDIANGFFDDVANSMVAAFQKGGGGAKAMWKSFESAAAKAIADIEAQFLKSTFKKLLGGSEGDGQDLGGLFGKALGGLFGGGSSDAMPDSFLNASDLEIASFDKGGYTGMGGGAGIDGKGGFMAVLHPDEQVLNGSQWRSQGRNNGSSINNNIVIQATNQNDIDRRLMSALPLITDHVTNAVLNNMNSGGNMTRAIQRRV